MRLNPLGQGSGNTREVVHNDFLLALVRNLVTD